MNTLPPYIYERDSYHLIDQADRWIFNKLILGERLGHNCGPVGTRPSSQVEVIVRPQMNIFGMGRGGFYDYDDWPFAAWDNVPNANPGYFWAEMFHGEHSYTGFVDDVAKHCNYCLEVPLQNNQEEAYIEDVTRAPALPAALQGISKYLFVEAIDGNIIEVAPRLGMQGARQKYIDEYKLIDPTWVEPNDLGFGLVDQRLRPDIAGGHRWEAQESTRRPFVQDL